MKTIGVLGGLGPQATMDFEERVHAVSQRLIPPMASSGYPPMVVFYHRYPPMVVDDTGKPVVPLQLEPHIVEVLGKLGQMVDFMVITANGPHLLREQIEESSGRKVLSMIEIALEEVGRRGWRRVGLLGLGDPMVYKVEMDRLGLAYETLPGEPGGLRERLDRSILALMEGRAGQEGKKVALEAVDALRAKGVDGVVLGCTEIPLLLGEAADAADLINPGELLAEAAVRFAIS